MKIILRFIYLIIFILFLIISYLTFIGIETNKFNNHLSNKIKNLDKNLEIDLKKIKIQLEPLALGASVKTIGPKLKYRDKAIQIESIKTQISIWSLITKKFSLNNLGISTRSVELKKFISFVRSIKQSPQLYIFESLVKKGYIIADVNLRFDNEGQIKEDFIISGIIKDAKISFLNNYNLEKLNFNFNLIKEQIELGKINFKLNELKFESEEITALKKGKNFFVNGKINGTDLQLDKVLVSKYLQNFQTNFDIKNLNLNLENKFSFKFNEKFKLDDFGLLSLLEIKELRIENNIKLDNFFPELNKEIKFSNNKIEINYKKNNFSVKGSGEITLQKNIEKLNYFFQKENNVLNFDTELNLKNDPFNIKFLNYEKKGESELKLNIKGKKNINKDLLIKKISLIEEKNSIEIKDIILDDEFKILSLNNASFNYFDNDNQKNKFNITKKEKNYFLNGIYFNANPLIEDLIRENEKKSDFFDKQINLGIQIDEVRLDNEHVVSDLKGNLQLYKNEILNANLNAFFTEKEKLSFTVKSDTDGRITTLFVDKAEPFVKKYKFIKGYEDGLLDFSSTKRGKRSDSTLKLYDFKLKELPILTKLLTLASLQGIADILSGEGIRFDEFEMNFNNEGSLMTIDEIYAIGPAISILMDGYIEQGKLISLRGTLVPATTINKAIGSIPVLGKILVGTKTGEGVFGVSFKIKGPPKKLETSVNPIKTLTPRFITRTLEKIKKN